MENASIPASAGALGELLYFPVRNGSNGSYLQNDSDQTVSKGVRGSTFESKTSDGSDRIVESPSDAQGANTSESNAMNISREELDAKLGLNKAEVEVIASEMRREMAEFRAFQSQQFASINTSLAEIKGEINAAKAESLGQKEGLSGQIDGVKSSISTMQWMIGTVLTMVGIVVAVLAIPGIDKIIK